MFNAEVVRTMRVFTEVTYKIDLSKNPHTSYKIKVMSCLISL